MRLRMIERAVAVALFASAAASAFGAGQMSIAQIDSSRLLTRHEVDVYLRVSGPNGQVVPDLTALDFTLFEGSRVEGGTGGALAEVRRFSLFRGPRPGEGITYLMLVDTSPPGSIDAVRSALRSFVNSIDDPADRIGLVSFGTRLHTGALPTRTRRETEAAVETLHPPAGPGARMPLASAIASAAGDLAGLDGRKVIILITGNPSISGAGLADKLLGTQTSLSVIELAAGAASSALTTIARASGGEVLAAETRKQLESALLSMNAAIRDEYRLTFSPRMTPGARREVRVEYHAPGGVLKATAYYTVGDIYAAPAGGWKALYLVPLVVSFAGLAAASRLRLPTRGKGPRLEFLGPLWSRFLPLAAERTDISLDSGRLTAVPLAGEGSEAETMRLEKGRQGGVTGRIRFTYERATGSCTVESDEAIVVNNRKTRRRPLRDGDVLRIGDATIVFDDT